MNLTITKKLLCGFGTGLIILFIIGVISYQGITTMLKSSQWTEHTYEVLGDVGKILSALKDAETGQRGYLITGEERYLEPYYQSLDEIPQIHKNLKILTSDNFQQQQRLDKIKPLIGKKLSELKTTIDLRRNQGFDAAVAVVLTDEGKEIMDNMRVIFNDFIKEEDNLLKERRAFEENVSNTTRGAIVFGFLIAMVVMSVLAVVIIRSIVSPIRIVAKKVEEIARSEGDLTDKVVVESKDELGALATSFNELTAGLTKIIVQIRAASADINTSSREILVSSQEQAAQAKEQSVAVSETSVAAKELLKSAESVGESVKKVSQISSHTMSGMEKIKDSLGKTSQIILALNEKSREISKITDVIDDVADQTNLLAVNASIEAARAGEQGKGFTVVADEIRKLADSTASSTKDITALVEIIQHEMFNAIISMEQSVVSVEDEVRLVMESAESTKEISMSAAQQIRSSQQISDAMRGVDDSMKQIAVSSEQTQTAITQLSHLGKELDDIVSKFKISQGKRDAF